MITTEWYEDAIGMPKPTHVLCWTWDYANQWVTPAKWNGQYWEHWNTGESVQASHWANMHIPAKPRNAW